LISYNITYSYRLRFFYLFLWCIFFSNRFTYVKCNILIWLFLF